MYSALNSENLILSGGMREEEWPKEESINEFNDRKLGKQGSTPG